MTTPELKDLLETIVGYAPKLRDAGIIGVVTIEGVGSFELARDAAAADDDDAVEPERHLSPLDDPETFGLGPDVEIPRLMPRKAAQK